MQFKYIGGEGEPGSGATTVCGNIKVAVGGVFECPDHLIERAKRNPFFEPVEIAEASVAGESKAELIARAEAEGVTIDKRWSAARILQALSDKGKS